jgi:hypothetical protein
LASNSAFNDATAKLGVPIKTIFGLAFILQS